MAPHQESADGWAGTFIRIAGALGLTTAVFLAAYAARRATGRFDAGGIFLQCILSLSFLFTAGARVKSPRAERPRTAFLVVTALLIVGLSWTRATVAMPTLPAGGSLPAPTSGSPKGSPSSVASKAGASPQYPSVSGVADRLWTHEAERRLHESATQSATATSFDCTRFAHANAAPPLRCARLHGRCRWPLERRPGRLHLEPGAARLT